MLINNLSKLLLVYSHAFRKPYYPHKIDFELVKKILLDTLKPASKTC